MFNEYYEIHIFLNKMFLKVRRLDVDNPTKEAVSKETYLNRFILSISVTYQASNNLVL